MTSVTRRYKFAASHRLQSAKFSAEENSAIYGKCNNPYGHGHDYELEVRVSGPINPESGQVVKVNTLDRLVNNQVLAGFDHKYLNADIGEFRDLVPTSENILRVIQKRLASHWNAAFPSQWPRLDAIRLRETGRNSFELRVAER
jgi:6-pyruvoyltetrahydropterin/6-carboxytetrahydropterin synthase